MLPTDVDNIGNKIQPKFLNSNLDKLQKEKFTTKMTQIQFIKKSVVNTADKKYRSYLKLFSEDCYSVLFLRYMKRSKPEI
jgi:hypothetical protein